MAARSVSDYNSHVSSRASNSVTLNQVERGKSETYIGCRLFGIDLNNHHINPTHPEKELACPSYASSGAKSPTPAVSEADMNQNADLLKSLKEEAKEVQAEGLSKETQSKQGCTTSNRTRTKVQMEGVPVGCAVDLTALEGYGPLIDELEKMFEIKGELRLRNKWQVVYTDVRGI